MTTPDPGRPMQEWTVRRTYLARVVQQWVITVPADYDPDEWAANDFSGFDETVVNEGDPVELDGIEYVDDDDLTLEVTARVDL